MITREVSLQRVGDTLVAYRSSVKFMCSCPNLYNKVLSSAHSVQLCFSKREHWLRIARRTSV